MADQEDELRIAHRLSTSPGPKRSKPVEHSYVGEELTAPQESPEIKNRRIQRELLASAAEKRIAAAKSVPPVIRTNFNVPEKQVEKDDIGTSIAMENAEPSKDAKTVPFAGDSRAKGDETDVTRFGVFRTLSTVEAEEVFVIIFGKGFNKEILSQWCNQGISFSDDPGTSMGLVQHEGGPCGVLAAIQVVI